jgi:hypothetical protein
MSLMQTPRPGAPKPSPSKKINKKRRISNASVLGNDADHVEELAGSGGEDQDGSASKKKVLGKAGAGTADLSTGPVEHKYAAEISQMVCPFPHSFWFGLELGGLITV